MNSRKAQRSALVLGVVAAALSVPVVAASTAGAASASLTRAPYLSDLTSSAVKVNFGTSTSIAKVRARYGVSSGGSCTLTSVGAATTTRQGYTVSYPSSSGTATAAGNQWKIQLSGLGKATYCYRIEGATSSSSTSYTDLLGTAASPTFRTTTANTFAVIGDWGQTGPGAPDYTNVSQANVISRLAHSGASFALATGDIGYPSGSQSTYGDLTHTGPGVSAVFGPKYWPVAGKSIPLYPTPGNHGFNSTFTSLWPSTSVAAASGGRAGNGSHTVNGSTVTAPDFWYAFNVNGWRIYNLTAAWATTTTTGSSAFAEDYKQHWAPGAPERKWLTADLTNHSGPKMVVFHYPLYSAVQTGDVQDNYLTDPPDNTQSVENLLATHNVKLVFNGHSHIYQRNNVHNGLVSIVSGGGGAGLSPVARTGQAMCEQTFADNGRPVVARAVGWSSSGGSACHTTVPTSAAHVYNFLKVTLSSGTATVHAIDSTGAQIDSVTVSG